MVRLLRLAFLGLVFPAMCVAQGPPSSDIYLVPINPACSRLIAEKAINITKRDGYDNQPHFLPDGSLFYTSIREDNQADIYRYDPKTGTTERVTRTAESEYSPTLMPDGRHFSAIRVEANNEQRLWQFELNGSSPKVLLETVKAVGYHAWFNPNRLGLFIVGNPHTLQLVSLGEEQPQKVLENIGRCFSPIPGRPTISVVSKQDPNHWQLMEISADGSKTALMTALPGSEDYAWTPAGIVIMAQGKKIYRSTPLAESPWQPLADFSDADFQQINRLAISKDGRTLAMVVAN